MEWRVWMKLLLSVDDGRMDVGVGVKRRVACVVV